VTLRADIVQCPSPATADRGAVVVVVYGRDDDLPACIESLNTHLPPGVAIVVVDNASPRPLAPAIASRFPAVHVLRARENGGYAGGNNIGADYALSLGTPLLYFLNDDTVVTAGFWEACEEALADPTTAVAGSILVHFARPTVMQIAGWTLDRDTLCEGFRGVEETRDESFAGRWSCDAVFGAAFMMRGPVFAALGGFDERFFHLSEELDLCLRTRAAGHEVCYAGGSLVLHKGGASLSHAAPRYAYYLFRNRLWLWRRHASRAVFLRRAPQRIGRMLLEQWRGRSWLRRDIGTLWATLRGCAAGFFTPCAPVPYPFDSREPRIHSVNTAAVDRSS
jgi:GT2 family glycosyltransferase